MNSAIEIRAARARKKISQRNLALSLGVTQQLVSAWENGEAVASSHWEKIKEEIGVDLALIVKGGEGSQGDISANGATVSGPANIGSPLHDSISIQADSCPNITATVGRRRDDSEKGNEGLVNAQLTPMEHEILVLARAVLSPIMLAQCRARLLKEKERQEGMM